ncbi:NAD(P)/FAD-dependent oxidoreductase [Aidingimonas lacisalsi]|uniref:NAD(P)/FAD-dependent oxidoreductase n=1 Tax=Aidingimonas lacisalsi TaxID=2604086 RepID=UPI0011D2640A|nr:NAD(P)/FAD-dependent oxidoreductase [Aidingimonas lacisalsi]
MNHHEVVVIGSGPAGMAAANTLLKYGLKPAVIDEQPAPGGQIYRSIGESPIRDSNVLGKDYWYGKKLVGTFNNPDIDYYHSTSVWQITKNLEIGVLKNDHAWMIKAKYVILATGAIERPCPIVGWTLPGVMTAGSAQILLKSSGVVPSGPLVLAGSGPLLYLLAAQYIRAGVDISTILETTPKKNYIKACRYLPKSLSNYKDIVKGVGLINEIRKAGVSHVKNVIDIRAEGNGELEKVVWKESGGSGWKSTNAATLLLHQGVVPNTQITRAIGCEHYWDDVQLAWRPKIDNWCETSIKKLAVAGDGAGIVGARASEIQGKISALGAVMSLNSLSGFEIKKEYDYLKAMLKRECSIRPFLDTLYRPSADWRLPSDDTTICRCEEVTAGEIKEAAKLGCKGPNQTKSFTRCGMGPCQGRVCGPMVSEILASVNGQSIDDTGYYRLRPPFKPITLGQLAHAAEE